jgi:hypothetical protein
MSLAVGCGFGFVWLGVVIVDVGCVVVIRETRDLVRRCVLVCLALSLFTVQQEGPPFAGSVLSLS